LTIRKARFTLSGIEESEEIMIETTSDERETHPGVARLLGLYLLAIGFSLIANLLIRVGHEAGWFGHAAKVSVAVVSVIPLRSAIGLFWRMLRDGLDEMLQRIVLEGLALALTVYFPLAALYANLRAAGVHLPRLDPPDVLLFPALLTALGVAIASRRYR
jgi:hypothetical protein